ncbi:hypothetical protein C8R41DRAFT_317733 [Lentinula lateritia]|uniref:Uncharacterized protein n=1 Tax=Lentinula lateritia TaxID=40482 RepID=A0ABQ8VGU7_9AGAR|nr:hypothetical protein C8R41DRAFT_317733 [Lentinula lateritia]
MSSAAQKKAMDLPRWWIKWLIYTSLCLTANLLDTFLSFVISKSKPLLTLQPSDVDNLSDDEV